MAVTTKRRRPAARRRQRRAPEPAIARARLAVAAHLGRQSDDVWGVILVVAGLLAAFGIYADLTGPVGRLLPSAARYALRWGRYGVPVGLCAVRGVLSRLRPRDD